MVSPAAGAERAVLAAAEGTGSRWKREAIEKPSGAGVGVRRRAAERLDLFCFLVSRATRARMPAVVRLTGLEAASPAILSLQRKEDSTAGSSEEED